MDVVNCGSILVDGKTYRIQSHSSNGYREPVSAARKMLQPRYNEEEDEEFEGMRNSGGVRCVCFALQGALLVVTLMPVCVCTDDATIVPDERPGSFRACISADQELFGYIIGKQVRWCKTLRDKTLAHQTG
eukprot:5616375-Pyramimonas_sp.AAC.1